MKYFIETYGCQMNHYDTERILRVMARRGYQQTDSIDSADLIVLNTCSVREKAEQKVYSALGSWREFKKHRDGVVIVPREIADGVVAKTEEVVATESEMRRALMSGMDPVEAYDRYGKF